MPSYSESLLLKNVFLALTYRTANFPSTLHQCGYDEVYIEKAFTNSQLKHVRYDFAASAPARNRSVLLEVKGGQYTRPEEQRRLQQQVQRYAAVTGEDVVQKAGFSVAPGLDPRQHEPQSFVVGIEGQMDGIMAVIPASTSIPLLEARVDTADVTYGGAVIVQGSCTDPQLAAHLGALPRMYPIPTTLPFDLESRDIDIADAIVPVILQLFYRLPSVTTFRTQDVIEQAIPIWPLIDADEQRSYLGRVRRILGDLAAHGFRGWFEWDNGGRQWRIMQSLGQVHAERMRTFRRLQSLQHQALGRLGGGHLQQATLPLDGDEP